MPTHLATDDQTYVTIDVVNGVISSNEFPTIIMGDILKVKSNYIHKGWAVLEVTYIRKDKYSDKVGYTIGFEIIDSLDTDYTIGETWGRGVLYWYYRYTDEWVHNVTENDIEHYNQ